MVSLFKKRFFLVPTPGSTDLWDTISKTDGLFWQIWVSLHRAQYAEKMPFPAFALGGFGYKTQDLTFHQFQISFPFLHIAWT